MVRRRTWQRIGLDWIGLRESMIVLCVYHEHSVLYVAQVNIFGIEKRLFQITVIIVVYLFYTVC